MLMVVIYVSAANSLIIVGETSKGEINEGNERSKLKERIETTSVKEASSGPKKIDLEIEETLIF